MENATSISRAISNFEKYDSFTIRAGETSQNEREIING
jgi:hypothetical protein